MLRATEQIWCLTKFRVKSLCFYSLERIATVALKESVPHCLDYLRCCLQEEEDVTKKMGGGKERHFSYYAYAGLSGIRHWTHRCEVNKILIFDLSCS